MIFQFNQYSTLKKKFDKSNFYIEKETKLINEHYKSCSITFWGTLEKFFFQIQYASMHKLK